MGLELLAPARNAEQGILALRCGADAVYMGGARFGARQAAGNGPADFERLASEARLWDAKVYATINTILFDEELEAARHLAWELHEAGVDALIVQDMALLELDLPPLPLFASTQAVCDGPEKVAFLAGAGFSRAILARELDLADIRAIHAAADIELEAFVFGALCVGESGRCYLSG
ncbi:MAG TPA: peptidase U32 family protein, partial [Holophaga sp.]|nr:peptidase U32 family protein [Holophaga sp.]